MPAPRRKALYERRTSLDAKNLQDIIREKTDDGLLMINALVEIVENPESQREQLAASALLLDRGWGKATERIEVGEAGAFSGLSDEELEKQLRERAGPVLRALTAADGGEE